MAFQLNKSWAYDSAASAGRFLIWTGTGVPQYSTGLKGASATSAILQLPNALTVYGLWAAVGTATGTAASVFTQITTASTGVTTATYTGAQTVTPYTVNVSGTTTTTTTYSNAKVTVGTGQPRTYTALNANEGGVPCAAGDQLYFVLGTDATADTVVAWEVGVGPLQAPTSI
jgi:hypothetical protein